MKEIKLSQTLKCKNSGLNLVALVDDEDYERLNKFNWHILKGKNTFYAKSTNGLLMHRVIMCCTKGDGKIIDHWDGNGLNCQKYNLRICTNSENCRNRKFMKKKTSKYIGVSFYKTSNSWVSQIMKDRKKIFLGYFKTEENAALAYNEAAKRLHGEFATLNIL